jgi:ketosteroid isomerase-like protein
MLAAGYPGQTMRIAILPSAFIAALLAAAPAFADDAATIKRLSQQFSDASASGDATVLGRLLDARVIFINEGGDIATKTDIVSSAGPAPKSVHNTLTQTHFKVALFGNTAVTSFDDVLAGTAHGQALHATFRSTEVWLKEGADWKMISSQTLALQDDPPAITLPAATLDEYAGTYQAGDLTFRIARAGGGLTGTVAGAAPIVIKAELRDVLFTPGVPRVRRLIQRDAAGKVTGFISRHEGHDLVFKRVV